MSGIEFIEQNRELIEQVIGKRMAINSEEQAIKSLKGQLQEKLEAMGMDAAEDETCRLKIIKDSLTTTIDVAALEKNEPELYVSLLNRYLKLRPVKGYLRVAGKAL